MYDFGRMNKVKKWQWGLLFVVLCALCFLYPYTGDDWAWGSSIGIERLNTWFDNYSGRYFRQFNCTCTYKIKYFKDNCNVSMYYINCLDDYKNK